MKIDVDAEREFHNRRFAEDSSREAQCKYYWAIESGAGRYWSLVTKYAPNADVLDYGCGNGEQTRKLAPVARSIHSIDISDVAIARATQQDNAHNVQFHVMDGSRMSFANGQFDVVFGSGIIHHLDTELCMQEIARVLKPSGHAIFWEPLGSNPIINLYRYFTPNDRTKDEHPLLDTDFDIMRRFFRELHIERYGFTSLAAVGFRNSTMGGYLRDALARVDRRLFALSGLRNLAWYSVLKLAK
jgi:SAM-dependent methyltransferase